MNMQQMIIQAQKIQREMKKAREALALEEFKASRGGAVTVIMMGDRTIKSVNFEEGVLEEDNKEMIEEMLAGALNECLAKIDEAEAAIEEKYAGMTGMGF